MYRCSSFHLSASGCRLSFSPMVSQRTGQGPMAVKVADFNNDTFLDIVVANFDGNTTDVLLGYGNGSFQQYIELQNGPGAGTNGIAIGDIDNDHHLDIVVVNRLASTIGVFRGYGNGSFSQQISTFTGTNSTPAGLVLHDLNNDQILDVVVTDHMNDRLLLLTGAGNGSFIDMRILPTGNYSGPYLVIVNDFNRDALPDIAVGNGDANYISIFLGSAAGNFSEPINYDIKSGPYALIAGYFNRDDILDIATANYDENSTSVLLGNGDGTFKEQKRFSTGSGSLPYAIESHDFNEDHIQDLIVPNSGTDNIGILLGNGNEIFRKQIVFSTGTGSSPVDVAVGDVNGDSRLDFISANNQHDAIGIFLNACSS